MNDAQTLTETPTTASKERDARLLSYKRTAAEYRISDLFTALEASDAQSARKHAEDLNAFLSLWLRNLTAQGHRLGSD